MATGADSEVTGSCCGTRCAAIGHPSCVVAIWQVMRECHFTGAESVRFYVAALISSVCADVRRRLALDRLSLRLSLRAPRALPCEPAIHDLLARRTRADLLSRHDFAHAAIPSARLGRTRVSTGTGLHGHVGDVRACE